jgi:hypothetical protein
VVNAGRCAVDLHALNNSARPSRRLRKTAAIPSVAALLASVLAPGPSPFQNAWRSVFTEKILVAMPSVSDTLASHNAQTGLWSGFTPDFLKLMSLDLGFVYDIIDINAVCAVELIEGYRAVLRKGYRCSDVAGFADDPCCTTAANYYRDDLFLFDFNQSLGLDQNPINHWHSTHLSRNSSRPPVNHTLGFPFIVNDGPRRGEILRLGMILHPSLGEHVRTPRPFPAVVWSLS